MMLPGRAGLPHSAVAEHDDAIGDLRHHRQSCET